MESRGVSRDDRRLLRRAALYQLAFFSAVESERREKNLGGEREREEERVVGFHILICWCSSVRFGSTQLSLCPPPRELMLIVPLSVVFAYWAIVLTGGKYQSTRQALSS